MFVFLFYKSTTVVIVSLPFTVLNEELQTPVQYMGLIIMDI